MNASGPLRSSRGRCHPNSREVPVLRSPMRASAQHGPAASPTNQAFVRSKCWHHLCVMSAMRLYAALPLWFLIASCASSPPSGLDRSLYTVDVCLGGRWDALAKITPADPAGYLELDVSSSTLGGAAQKSIESKRGASCVTAAQPATCASTLANSSSTTGWRSETCGGAGCSTAQRFFVAEKGGAVSVVDTIELLRALVVPVDSPADAALLAAFADGATGGIECPGPQVLPNADGSFEVFLATGGAPCTGRHESRVHVSVDGTARTVDTASIAATQTCISP